jgi:putative sterol carrier protein
MPTIESYLRSMERTFSRERAKGKHVALQYTFTGSQCGVCHAVIEDGVLCVGMGPHPAPTATVTCDFDLWMRIMAYELDGLLAYQDGLFSAGGDIEALLESDSWFVRAI